MRRCSLLLLALVAGAISAAPVSAQPTALVVAGHGSIASGPVVTVAAFDVAGRVGGVLRVDNGPGFLFVSRVTCVAVVEGRVLVGGVIVRSPTPETLGNTSLVAIDDGGPGGADSIGIAFSRTGLDSCPVFGLPMHPVSSGNFVVVGSG
jgi:hypothetical protein